MDDKIELKIKGKSLEVNVDYMEENNSGGYDITCKLSETIEELFCICIKRKDGDTRERILCGKNKGKRRRSK